MLVAAFIGLGGCTVKQLANGDTTIKYLSTAAMACEFIGSLCVKFGYQEGALGVSLLDGRTSGASKLRNLGLFVHAVGVCLAIGVLYEAGTFKSEPGSY